MAFDMQKFTISKNARPMSACANLALAFPPLATIFRKPSSPGLLKYGIESEGLTIRTSCTTDWPLCGHCRSRSGSLFTNHFLEYS